MKRYPSISTRGRFGNDLQQECRRLGNPRLPDQSPLEHSALADAAWNRVAHTALAEINEATVAEDCRMWNAEYEAGEDM